MRRRTVPLVVLAVAALTLALAPAASGAHYAGLDENDVSNEPHLGTDQNDIGSGVDGIPGNGFADLTDNTFDLILDGYAVPNDVYPVDPNTVLVDLLAEVGQEGAYDHVVYPGQVDYNAWWGWWNDQGSGSWSQEVQGTGPSDFAIDDGADNHSADVDWQNRQDCPVDDPLCWQDTGPWDEFTKRNGGVSDWFQGKPVDSDDPGFASYDDSVFLFVDPGTQTRRLAFLFGNSEEQTGPSRPGHGVLNSPGSGPDDPRFHVVDDVCKPGNDEDNQSPGEPGPEDVGDRWHCVTGFTADRSLLVTTELRVAAGENIDTGPGENVRDISTAVAVDTDHYNTIHPLVGDLYQTAVWDPGDERDDDVGESVNWDEGVKGRVHEAYSEDFTTAYGTATGIASQVLAPLQTTFGAVQDRSYNPPWPHEPNHPEDVYPGAEHNDGAWYNGSFDDEYYSPTQSWDGYQTEEHLWAEFYQYYTPLPNLLLGGGFGLNTEAPNSPDEQNTHAPGFLVPFARVGTWHDASQDTWIGNDHPIHAYDNGTEDDPNAYGSDELRYVCGGEGSLSATFYPADEAQSDNNGDGEIDVEDRPWGTTNPPMGVYHYNTFGAFLGGIPADVQDGELDRHVQYGTITIGLGCSGDQTGTWYPGDAILMPAGSFEYDIKVEGTAEWNGNRTSRATGNLISNETVTDVDIVDSWT